MASAGGFNFIQLGFEPPLNGIPICIHLTTYRSGRLLLNKVNYIELPVVFEEIGNDKLEQVVQTDNPNKRGYFI